MDKRGAIKRGLEYGLELSGGAAAGYLDAKYPDKGFKLGSEHIGLGTIVAGAGLAVGVLGIGGRFGRWAGDIGAGAAAFEVGKMVQGKVAAAPATSGVRGVGALPSSRHVSQAEIRQALRDLAHA